MNAYANRTRPEVLAMAKRLLKAGERIRFSIVEDLVARGDPGSNYHLVDYQTQQMVSTLWTKYLAQASAGLESTPVGPVMRRASYSLDNDCMPGTCDAAVGRADDGKTGHDAEIVTVFVDPARGSVEIPADFWAAVEKMEGRSIPLAERPSVAAATPG